MPPIFEDAKAVFNFTPVPREDYRIGVPRAGYYTELLNSDAEIYGGGNIGNASPAGDSLPGFFEHHACGVIERAVQQPERSGSDEDE